MPRTGLASGLAALVVAAALPASVLGQGTPTAPVEGAVRSPVLTIRQQELFERSDFGTASLARINDRLSDLQTENRRIEAGLETEERDLTAKRATLPAKDFRTLAEAFDRKVEGIRAAQDQKSRDVSRERDADQKRFSELAFPILAEMMRSLGADALLDQSAVVLSLDRIDVTDEAIGRLNEALKAEVPGRSPPSTAEPDAGGPSPTSP